MGLTHPAQTAVSRFKQILRVGVFLDTAAPLPKPKLTMAGNRLRTNVRQGSLLDKLPKTW